MSNKYINGKLFRIAFSILILGLLTACNYKSSGYKELEAERDSLLKAQESMQGEIDNYFSSMNQIEQNIEAIKKTQSVIKENAAVEQTNEESKDKISEDLQFIHDMLKSNQQELDKLKRRLRASAIKSSELERTLQRLTKSLEEEMGKVAILEKELSDKNLLIAEMKDEIGELSQDIQELSEQTENQKSTIKEQDKAMNTAWYVFGTSKELKAQKIINSGGLFKPSKVLEGEFNKNYFVRIDARNTKSIPLYSSRARIMTTHPKASYTLEKESGSYTLLINDPENFWSVSKYLVIEVD